MAVLAGAPLNLPDAVPSACAARDVALHYISYVTLSLHEVPTGQLTSGTIADSTLLAAGLALLLGPALFGKDWVLRVLWLFALIVGALGSSMLISSGQGKFALSCLGLASTGTKRCLAELAVLLVGAISAGSLAMKLVGLSVGLAAGLAAFYALQTLAPLVMPLVESELILAPTWRRAQRGSPLSLSLQSLHSLSPRVLGPARSGVGASRLVACRAWWFRSGAHAYGRCSRRRHSRV